MSVVAEYLRFRGIRYEVVPHKRALSSIGEAAAVGVRADEVLKTVVVDCDGLHALVVIPASRRVDLRLVRGAVSDHGARLANEWELEHDFRGYELGAMPPIGSLVGARTFVDPEVFLHHTVIFAAGSQTESLKCRTEDLFQGELITVVPLTDGAVRAEKELVP